MHRSRLAYKAPWGRRGADLPPVRRAHRSRGMTSGPGRSESAGEGPRRRTRTDHYARPSQRSRWDVPPINEPKAGDRRRRRSTTRFGQQMRPELRPRTTPQTPCSITLSAPLPFLPRLRRSDVTHSRIRPLGSVAVQHDSSVGFLWVERPLTEVDIAAQVSGQRATTTSRRPTRPVRAPRGRGELRHL